MSDMSSMSSSRHRRYLPNHWSRRHFLRFMTMASGSITITPAAPTTGLSTPRNRIGSIKKWCVRRRREAVQRLQRLLVQCSSTTSQETQARPRDPTKSSTSFDRFASTVHNDIYRLSCLSFQGFFTLYLYVSEGDVRTIILVLWMALAVIVPADFLRFRFKGFARTYEKLLGFLMRESERVRDSQLSHST